MWRCGSPTRLVRCRNAAATIPFTSIWFTPAFPVRDRVASRSTYPTAASTAASCASRTPLAVSGSPRPASSDTDFGARNVRSNPATSRPGNRPSRSDVAGLWPAQIACRSPGVDLAVEVEGAAAVPTQRPGASPTPR